MQIGTETSFSRKSRIGFAIFSTLSFALCFFIIKHLVIKSDSSIQNIVIQGAISGLLFGLIFPPSMSLLSKRIQNQPSIKFDFGLNENEIIEAEGPANLFRKIEGVGGKLFLTNQRIVFSSHQLNIQKGATSIAYSEIASVQPRKTSGFINNGISIRLRSGEEYKFVVNDRDTWLKEINKRL